MHACLSVFSNKSSSFRCAVLVTNVLRFVIDTHAGTRIVAQVEYGKDTQPPEKLPREWDYMGALKCIALRNVPLGVSLQQAAGRNEGGAPPPKPLQQARARSLFLHKVQKLEYIITKEGSIPDNGDDLRRLENLKQLTTTLHALSAWGEHVR